MAMHSHYDLDRGRLSGERWLTTREAAEYLSYSVKSITRFCRDGLLKHRRIGSRAQYRFRVEWLDDFAAPVEECRMPRKLPTSHRLIANQSSGALAALVEKQRLRDAASGRLAKLVEKSRARDAASGRLT